MPRQSKNLVMALLEDHPVYIGLLVRLILMFALPILMDDGLLLQGVRYTDIDYDVFTDAAEHVAHGRSPYERHTYRYTPFLAKLLALPLEYGGNSGSALWNAVFSTKYFGKILFCIADVICGYIIISLRRRKQISSVGQQSTQADKGLWKYLQSLFSHKLIDALWWLYNPLPINICTRGSAESLVVLLPVLATLAVVDMYQSQPHASNKPRGTLPIIARACFAGILHGIGIHAKLYPVIYTISFMASFSLQQQQREMFDKTSSTQQQQMSRKDAGWRYLLSEQIKARSDGVTTFPWAQPKKILVLAIFWVQRFFFTMSSILFLAFSMGTVWFLTYLAVYYYGQDALNEGLLYHFQRVDHRHNYSMYWYWIYLSRGRAEVSAAQSSSVWGFIPLVPQILILGFSSLGIAPYDLSFALFCQTFAFVAFNKVITAQYFTWYLCLLPLCSDRVNWKSKRMFLSLGVLIVSIITWLLSAFTLEMLGWKSHRQVWMASLFFFIANVNLLHSILCGYRPKRDAPDFTKPGIFWPIKKKAT